MEASLVNYCFLPLCRFLLRADARGGNALFRRFGRPARAAAAARKRIRHDSSRSGRSTGAMCSSLGSLVTVRSTSLRRVCGGGHFHNIQQHRKLWQWTFARRQPRGRTYRARAALRCIMRRSTRPLDRPCTNRAAASRAANMPCAPSVAYGHDEVGALAGDFNLMAEAVGDAHRGADGDRRAAAAFHRRRDP